MPTPFDTIKLSLISIATNIAQAHKLDPVLVCAICHHESANWKVFAARYEPVFYARYITPLKGLSATEMQLRAFSFGLMQIMGQTARELGFAGDDLTELFDPVTGIEFGCRKLARCLDRSKGDVRAALLMYNGGSNLKYPDLVLRHLTTY